MFTCSYHTVLTFHEERKWFTKRRVTLIDNFFSDGTTKLDHNSIFKSKTKKHFSA